MMNDINEIKQLLAEEKRVLFDYLKLDLLLKSKILEIYCLIRCLLLSIFSSPAFCMFKIKSYA